MKNSKKVEEKVKRDIQKKLAREEPDEDDEKLYPEETDDEEF